MDIAPLWWALSLGACLGGNGTLVGASANVVLSVSVREMDTKSHLVATLRLVSHL